MHSTCRPAACLLVLLAVGCGPVRATSVIGDAEAAIARARAADGERFAPYQTIAAELYLEDERYGSAIEHLQRVLPTRPDDTRVLIDLGSILAIFKPNHRLPLPHTIALFHSNPGDPSGNLRPHLDLVMRDDVPGRHQNRR